MHKHNKSKCFFVNTLYVTKSTRIYLQKLRALTRTYLSESLKTFRKVHNRQTTSASFIYIPFILIFRWRLSKLLTKYSTKIPGTSKTTKLTHLGNGIFSSFQQFESII